MSDERSTDSYFDENRDLWDAWAKTNFGSKFYDVDAFKSGKTSLMPVEIEELGDVAGKSMLHLQCHFGLDTLSWARMGARVTGVDFSEEAISLARSLSAELGIEVEFVRANIYDLPEVLEGKFDIVFTSYGALCWLSDIDGWAQIVRRYLKPGGIFYIVEFHPSLQALNDDGVREYPYFPVAKPLKFETTGSYAADEDCDFPHDSFEWPHGIGEIVTALISAGLRLEFLHEFPFTPYSCWPFLVESEPGKYVLKDHPNSMPLLFSIRAMG